MKTRRTLDWMACRFLALAVVALLAASAPMHGRANTPGVTWQERTEVARGDAHRGPWRGNESEFHYVDDPTVAMDERGRIGVAWADLATQDIFFQLFEPDGTKRFEEPANVSASPDVFSWLPRLVLSSDAAKIYILWQEIVFSGGSHGGEIYFARSLDGGKTFSKPLNLSNSPAGAGKGRLDPQSWHNGSLDLAVGPQEDLYATWTEYEGALWFSRSVDGGASFSEPLHIAGGDEEEPARGPSLAVGPRGAIHLAWTVGEDPAANIRIARSTDAGKSFGQPSVVIGEGHADAPKIAVDRAGTLHLVYAESAGGPNDRYRLHYTKSPAGKLDFQQPKEVAAYPDQGIDSAHFPALQLDKKDNLYLLWELFPEHPGRPHGLGFAHSTDGGESFAPPAVLPGSLEPDLGFNGSLQGLLMNKLAVNNRGALAVVNSTFQAGEVSRIWLFRGQFAGPDRAGPDRAGPDRSRQPRP